MVRCDAGVETQVQAVAKAASIAALEQFKISADRESLALPFACPQICSCCCLSCCFGCAILPGLVIYFWCAIRGIFCVASRLLLQLGLVLDFWFGTGQKVWVVWGRKRNEREFCIALSQFFFHHA